MSEPPVFVLDQPRGHQVQVDLSPNGGFGDFAFTVTDLTTGQVKHLDAYHSGEPYVFLAVLHLIAHARPAHDVLEDIARIRADVDHRTDGLTATTQSEHDFDRLLPRWLTTLSSEPSTETFGSSDRRYALVLTPADDGAVISWRRDETARPHHRVCRIPTGELWRFAAGMIWRSYENGRTAPFLTRVSTRAYRTALDAFESAVTAARATP